MSTYLSGGDLFAAWRGDVLSSDPPLNWTPPDSVFDGVEVAPGRIITVGGAPGAGKTALLMQWVCGMVERHPGIRVLVANVEMSPGSLLTRQLARVSGVPLTAIRKREVEPKDRTKVDAGLARLRTILDQLAFATDPHRLMSVATAGADFGAQVIVLDYLQRVEPSGATTGTRERLNALMADLRKVADGGGVAILAAAALTRSRDAKGRGSYDGQHLGLASFRESSELEYASDDCLLVYPTDDNHNAPTRSMMLAHVKSRHGEQRDRALTFHRSVQRFDDDAWSVEVSPSRFTTKAPKGGK